MTYAQPPAEIVALFHKRARFTIGVHKWPDGDALGSALGLFHALEAQGKQAELVAPTAPPKHYRWLPGIQNFRLNPEMPVDVGVVLDCEGPERLEPLQDVFSQASTLISLDHHADTQAFGHWQYADPMAASTAQLVYRLLKTLQWPLTPPIATCLYTGLATDTGFFRFENTDATALAEAAELAGAGAMPHAIAAAVNGGWPLARLRLLGRALAKLQTAAQGRIIWAALFPQDYKEAGATAADTEGIVEMFKQAEGQQAVALFKAPEQENLWHVSLRSPYVDVAAIARQWGGGGHARAAGCDITGSLAEASQRILAALEEALAEQEAMQLKIE